MLLLQGVDRVKFRGGGARGRVGGEVGRPVQAVGGRPRTVVPVGGGPTVVPAERRTLAAPPGRTTVIPVVGRPTVVTVEHRTLAALPGRTTVVPVEGRPTVVPAECRTLAAPPGRTTVIPVEGRPTVVAVVGRTLAALTGWATVVAVERWALGTLAGRTTVVPVERWALGTLTGRTTVVPVRRRTVVAAWAGVGLATAATGVVSPVLALGRAPALLLRAIGLAALGRGLALGRHASHFCPAVRTSGSGTSTPEPSQDVVGRRASVRRSVMEHAVGRLLRAARNPRVPSAGRLPAHPAVHDVECVAARPCLHRLPQDEPGRGRAANQRSTSAGERKITVSG